MEYTFKDSILRLHEMMGEGSITLEYDELPDMNVTVSIEPKTNEELLNEHLKSMFISEMLS